MKLADYLLDLKTAFRAVGDWKLSNELDALIDIADERAEQDNRWGKQNHPDGTGPYFLPQAEKARAECDARHRDGNDVWSAILKEEFFEALAESDEEKLREELVQCAAVCVAWIEAIDRRTHNAK